MDRREFIKSALSVVAVCCVPVKIVTETKVLVMPDTNIIDLSALV